MTADPQQQIAACLKPIRALRRRAIADPCAYFTPTSPQQRLFDAIERGGRQGILRMPNKSGKTEVLAHFAAALCSGVKPGWLPSKFRAVSGRGVVVLVMVPDLQTAALDFERLLLKACPAGVLEGKHEKGMSAGGEPIREASNHVINFASTGSVIRVLSWDALSDEKARRKTQGPGAHLVLIPEEAPPKIWGELVARTAETDGVVISGGTLALGVSAYDHRLDTEWYRQNVASRGPWCGDVNCQHTGEDNPLFFEVWAEYDRSAVPWKTRCLSEVCICGHPDCDRAIREYIDSIPEEERSTRVRAAWGREFKGRCYSGFYDAQHQDDPTAATLAGILPGGGSQACVSLTVDCGARDATAGVIAVVQPWPCEACDPTDPGMVRHYACSGMGCTVCRGRGRIVCEHCEGRGCDPEVWILADYMSEQGTNDTQDNANGLLDALSAAGFFRKRAGLVEGDAGAIDWAVGDNMMPKRFTDFDGELEALHSRMGKGLRWRFESANKRPSYISSWDYANDLFRRGRLHIALRCAGLRGMMSRWSFGPDGQLPKHGGHQGPSHLDAVVRYLLNDVRERTVKDFQALRPTRR